MNKIYKITTLVLLFSFIINPIQGESLNDEEDERCGAAYVESSQTAHWSVYIPITILVVAAILFGVADRDHKSHNSSDPQDALGSIDNSKRHSSHRSTRCSCKGGYFH